MHGAIRAFGSASASLGKAESKPTASVLKQLHSVHGTLGLLPASTYNAQNEARLWKLIL